MKNPDLEEKIKKLISSGDWQGVLRILGSLDLEKAGGILENMDVFFPFSVFKNIHVPDSSFLLSSFKYADEEESIVSGHLEKVFGPFETVSLDGLKCAFIRPCNLSYSILVSMGIGSKPSLSNRKEEKGYERTEIMLYLPPESDVEHCFWIRGLFSSLCRLSHDGKGFLAPFFMYDNGSQYGLDSLFSGCLLIPPLLGPSSLMLPSGETVSFLVAIPLYDEEMDYKDSFGLGRLMERMLPDAMIADIHRQSYAEPFEAPGPMYGCIADFGWMAEKFRKSGIKTDDKYAYATELVYFMIWAIRRYLISSEFLNDNGDLVHLVAFPNFADIRRTFWKAYDGILFSGFFSREGQLFARCCFSPDSYGQGCHYPSIFLHMARLNMEHTCPEMAGRMDPRFVFPYSEDAFKLVSNALDAIYDIWKKEQRNGIMLGDGIMSSSAVGLKGPTGCLVSPSVFNSPEKGGIFVRLESLDPSWDSGWRVYSSDSEKDTGLDDMLLMDLRVFENLSPSMRPILSEAGKGATYVLHNK